MFDSKFFFFLYVASKKKLESVFSSETLVTSISKEKNDTFMYFLRLIYLLYSEEKRRKPFFEWLAFILLCICLSPIEAWTFFRMTAWFILFLNEIFGRKDFCNSALSEVCKLVLIEQLLILIINPLIIIILEKSNERFHIFLEF